MEFLQRIPKASSKSVHERVIESCCVRVDSVCGEGKQGAGGGVWSGIHRYYDSQRRGGTEQESERGDQECRPGLFAGEVCMESPLIAEVEKKVGWPKLWDMKLDYGAQHTRGLQQVRMIMSHHGRGSRPCPSM